MSGLAGIGQGGGAWLALVGLSILATLGTVVICLNSSALASFTRLIDRPDLGRKLHDKDTPILGGIAMMVPTLAITIIEILFFKSPEWLLAATFAASVVMAIGVADDRLDVSAAWRLLGLFFVAFVAFSVEPLFVVHRISLDLFGLPLDVPFHSLAGPITVLMIVGFVNAVNMADGMNGQFLGSMLIWTALLITYRHGSNSAPLIALFCCTAVALFFNLRGKVFSGSAGAYAGALFIALCTITVYRQTNSPLSSQTVAIWFWLPVVDCVRLMAARALASKSPVAGDRRHLHHLLLAVLPQHQALIAYLALLGLPAAATLISQPLGEFVLLGCALCYGALVVGVKIPEPVLGTVIDAAE